MPSRQLPHRLDQRIAFSVPSLVALTPPSQRHSFIARSVIDGGEPEHAWIGITGRDLTPAMAKALDLEGRRGVVIAGLEEDGPAAKGELKAADSAEARVPRGGDLIIAINGQPVQDMADVSRAIASRRVGESITVTVLRDGQEKTVTLRLEDRPASIGRG